MSDNSENEDIEESLEVPLTKQKKPRSQAQIEAFEKVKEKRRQNLEAKKQEKLINSAKLLLEEETKKTSRVEHEVPLKKLLEPAVPVKPPSRQSRKYGVKGERRVPCAEPEPKSESESEEEVIVVKKSKPRNSACGRGGVVGERSSLQKKQKKVRKIIIEESSSEDEDDESEYEPEPPPRPQRKPIVRVIRPNPNDFFC
jgi:hypothetical protein